MAVLSITKKFVDLANDAISGCPLASAELFDSFDYTQTGNNFCHPRVWGLLVKAAWSLPEAISVEIDVRFNEDKYKFQPDIAVRNSKAEVFLAIDFESPNSCDTRIPEKDVLAYINWSKELKIKSGVPEYLIITSLPKKKSPTWELRYANKGNNNYGHKREEIRKNPFQYWYSYYSKNLFNGWRDYPITFANFDGNKLSVEKL